MIMFKACPRCQGDMHENKDMYGEYRECLMCGYMADLRKPGLFGMEMAPAPQEGIQAPGQSADLGDSSGLAPTGSAPVIRPRLKALSYLARKGLFYSIAPTEEREGMCDSHGDTMAR